MAKAPWCGEQVYAAVQSFRENCLREDGSLFTPGVEVWTLENVSAVERRVGTPDLSKRSFIDKLQDQLSGLRPQVVQLGAELVYMLLLAEHDTGGAKRREHITTILAALPTAVAMPPQIDVALDAGGVAAFGAAKAHRDAYMRFLARLCLTVKELSAEERARVIDDPWRFRELVEQLRSSADAMEANALLHLLFPETFEYMVSEGHRAKLIEKFAAAPGVADAENTDRKIAVIRQLAAEGSRPDLDLYEDPFHQVWAKLTPSRWEEAVQWAIRVFQWPRFDEEERTYKLEVAAKIADARNALLADNEGWLGALRSAFTHRRNNLTSWQAHDKFLRWCADNPQAARDALLTIWRAGGTAGVLIRPFLEALPNEAVKGSGTRVSFASFLLMGIDATRLPFYKPSVDQGFRRLLGQSATQEVDLDQETVYRPEELAARLGLDARRVRELHRRRRRIVSTRPVSSVIHLYEDFFEGYRPIQHEGGALSFELVPGALREIAGEAEAHPDRPHLLIIDEINRGNIAKIFGELYFLLEYRDEAIRLQYSRDEPFELPANLFFIGTMNTADRSIALVDTALRRRFRFVGLIPTKPPVDRVLSEWLTENGLDLEPADLLESLNQEIGSEEFAIGPSYLMTGDGSAPELEVVWEHAIMPLLEEHYYGTGRDLERDFGLSSLRKKLAAQADAAAAVTDDDQA